VLIKYNGNGMSKEIQMEIFDPSFTTKKIGEGMGLGLSMSCGIIEKHDGGIKVKSK
jgi:signal transduction histidine kinase